MTVRRTLLLGLALPWLAACATAPVNEPAGVPFDPPRATLPERTAQVARACSGAGWTVLERADGRVVARRSEGERMAEVEIGFDRDAFSIRRRASAAFAYENGEIAIDYNRWVSALRTTIQAQSSI